MGKKDLEAAPIDVVTSNDTAQPSIVETTDLLSSHVDSHASGYEGFDPAIHAMGPDGKPKTTKDGGFAKKRGRKAGSSPLPPPGASSTATPDAKPAPMATKEAAELAARTTLNLLFNVCVIGISDEWAPKPDEAQGMKAAFTDYYMVRGVPNIPPELALLGALAAYTIPRISQPKTQAKIRKLKAALSGRAADVQENDAGSIVTSNVTSAG